MVFYGAPPPPVDPNDARVIQRTSDDHHERMTRSTEDVGVITGWIWAGVRWPFRLLARVVRR